MNEFKRQFFNPPSDWKKRALSDFLLRVVEKNGSRESNVLTISAEHGFISQHEFFQRRVASDNTRGYYRLSEGDFAYNKSYSSGYPVGAIRRLDRYPSGVVSPLYICFRPVGDVVYSDFLVHYFDGGAIDRQLADVAREGARNHGLLNVGVEDFFSINTALPPLAEQKKIAKLLDTLDTAIHETEAIIAKLKLVKLGLLHDLLTRGIDDNGELRPPQSEAPHLYKESPLGWIPKEWTFSKLEDLLGEMDPAMRSGPFGSALLKEELVDVGIPLLGIDNVQTERFLAYYSRFVTPRKFAQLARYAVRQNDLMITIMGTVGRCCLVPEDVGQALSSKHTWAISINQEIYSPYLAMLQINYAPWVLKHFERDQQGGTMAAIRSDTLRATPLPTPRREEQCLMEERLRALSARIDLEIDSLAKRREEKSGLMDDLLTGRVRVTPLLEPAA